MPGYLDSAVSLVALGAACVTIGGFALWILKQVDAKQAAIMSAIANNLSRVESIHTRSEHASLLNSVTLVNLAGILMRHNVTVTGINKNFETSDPDETVRSLHREFVAVELGIEETRRTIAEYAATLSARTR